MEDNNEMMESLQGKRPREDTTDFRAAHVEHGGNPIGNGLEVKGTIWPSVMLTTAEIETQALLSKTVIKEQPFTGSASKRAPSKSKLNPEKELIRKQKNKENMRRLRAKRRAEAAAALPASAQQASQLIDPPLSSVLICSEPAAPSMGNVENDVTILATTTESLHTEAPMSGEVDTATNSVKI